MPHGSNSPASRSRSAIAVLIPCRATPIHIPQLESPRFEIGPQIIVTVHTPFRLRLLPQPCRSRRRTCGWGVRFAKGAIIGAAVGGVGGAIIGRQMDKQAEELAKDILGATVERVR